MAVTPMGKTTDGRVLSYDAALYEFVLDGAVAPYADVKMLDSRGWVRWRADVLREWFRHIVPADLQACHERAHAGLAAGRPAGSDAAAQPAAEQAGASVRVPGAAASQPAIAVEPVQQTGVPGTMASAHAAHAVRPASTVAYPADIAQAQALGAARPAQASGGAVSSVMKSFKSKDGKLAKDKSFSLSSSLSGEVVFHKIEGDVGITVKPRGKVVAEKGLPTGSYTVEVQAASMSDASTETIAVTVKVK